MDALGYVNAHVYPAASTLLPIQMWEREAFAMLTAIGLQESGFRHRRQYPQGPARGFWQCEASTVGLVMRHADTRPHLSSVLAALAYPADIAPAALHLALEHHDVLACVVARLLLWSDPRELPTQGQSVDGWVQYLGIWRPGKPHPQTWASHYARAWQTPVVLA